MMEVPKGMTPQEMVEMMQDMDDAPASPVLMYFIDGGGSVEADTNEGLIKRACEYLENEVLPDIGHLLGLTPQMNFQITCRHDADCPSQHSRDERDCTCERITCEALIVTPFQSAMLEATGMYDAVLDVNNSVIELKTSKLRKDEDDTP